MCGIYGEVDASGGAGRSAVVALESMAHRGPDGSGYWTDGVCALGHRRLAVIDLSPAGRQPLGNEDGSVQVTFNGEIYNYRELRRELEGFGHAFRTRTDTEVIVHAYEQWGERCVRRFRGMFAFAVWDGRRRRLFLARDRLGKKPLFFARTGDRFLFASEIRALLAYPELPREPDPNAIDLYLECGYVPAPFCAFRGIQKLPPACWLSVRVGDECGPVEIESYWSLQYTPKVRLSEAEACEALRERLTEAVRIRLESDVPLGAFLSGGVDSSIVVGLMAGLSDRPVKTFSVGFEDADHSELVHAERVARRWGTDHHPVMVRPDAVSVLSTLVGNLGEPFADSSIVPTYQVALATKRFVTVALNGDGGDESFAGYDRYRAFRVSESLASIPGLRGFLSSVSRWVPDSIHPRSRSRRVRRFLGALSRPYARRYARWLTYFPPERKRTLYSSEMKRALGPTGVDVPSWLEALLDQARGLDPVDAAMSADVRSYLPGDLLTKVDVATMTASLEARSPLLDHEVMEFAATLPPKFKLRGGMTKFVLKRAFQDLLPVENVARPKMGFGAPVGRWLRAPLRDLLDDALLSSESRTRAYLNALEVQGMVREHCEGVADHAFPLWSLLMLELWHREVVEASPASATHSFQSTAGGVA